MVVLGLTNKGGNWFGGEGWSGCGYHRILLPLALMEGVQGFVSDAIYDDSREGIDIIVYNRLSQYDEIWEKVRFEMGCKVVLDLDDYWRLPPTHYLYGGYGDTGDKIERNIIDADLVTVTHEELAERVRPFNKNVVVIPNGIPFDKAQFTQEKIKSDKVRIFWSGSITHERDLAILKNPLNKLLIHKNKIQMVLGGYNDDRDSKVTWDRMLSSFTLGGKLPHLKLNGVGSDEYMKMYENADIMVIPLEKDDWTSYKSNLKILEAGSKKIPCIVSNVPPYSRDADAPVLWVNNQTDWFTHLNYLILNPNAREDLGNKLYEWVKKKYDLEKINKIRYAAFDNLINHEPEHTKILHHFYHIYADGNWMPPVSEHIKALKEYGLYNALTTFAIGLVGTNENCEAVKKYISEQGLKYIIADQQAGGWEQVTQIPMWNFSKTHDGLMLYAHSKGSSDGSPVNIRWRRSMIWCNVCQWAICVDRLKTHDAVGCHWIRPRINQPEHEFGNAMFGGTFFWLRCDLMRTFPKPLLENRHQAEAWPGYKYDEQFYTVYDFTPYWPNTNTFADDWIDNQNYIPDLYPKSYKYKI